MSRRTSIGLAAAAFALSAPANAAAQATLEVDPIAPCYREESSVFLHGTGFSPNTTISFTRDSQVVRSREPVVTDASGAFFPRLDLPGLSSSQQRLTYVATDSANPALSAQVTMLVTATDVGLRPEGGPSNRVLTIRARGFFGDNGTLYAHVVRAGKRRGRARNMRIGRVRGACKTVQARRRLFTRSTPPGRYRVQFDTFRRFQPTREIETEFIITVFPTAGTAAVGSVSRASWR